MCILPLQASDHGSNSLGHLISLFVERSHQLWKAADVLQWLLTAATAAADVADGKQRTPSSSMKPVSEMTPDDVIVEGSAEDWACVAKESFPAAGRNEYGHLRLADFSDAVNALPQEEMQAVMGPAGGPAAAAGVSGDPVLDCENASIFERTAGMPVQTRQWRRGWLGWDVGLCCEGEEAGSIMLESVLVGCRTRPAAQRE